MAVTEITAKSVRMIFTGALLFTTPDPGAFEFSDSLSIKNSSSKSYLLSPQMFIYPNPLGVTYTIMVRNISSKATASCKLRIYDLRGRLVDELKLLDGKCIWSTNVISCGTYLIRVEGIANYSSRRVVLTR